MHAEVLWTGGQSGASERSGSPRGRRRTAQVSGATDRQTDRSSEWAAPPQPSSSSPSLARRRGPQSLPSFSAPLQGNGARISRRLPQTPFQSMQLPASVPAGQGSLQVALAWEGAPGPLVPSPPRQPPPRSWAQVEAGGPPGAAPPRQEPERASPAEGAAWTERRRSPRSKSLVVHMGGGGFEPLPQELAPGGDAQPVKRGSPAAAESVEAGWWRGSLASAGSRLPLTARKGLNNIAAPPPPPLHPALPPPHGSPEPTRGGKRRRRAQGPPQGRAQRPEGRQVVAGGLADASAPRTQKASVSGRKRARVWRSWKPENLGTY